MCVNEFFPHKKKGALEEESLKASERKESMLTFNLQVSVRHSSIFISKMRKLTFSLAVNYSLSTQCYHNLLKLSFLTKTYLISSKVYLHAHGPYFFISDVFSFGRKMGASKLRQVSSRLQREFSKK